MKNRNLLSKLAYFGLLVFGVIYLVTLTLGWLKVDSSNLSSIIKIAQDIATFLIILVVVFVGWEQAKTEALVWKVIFLIASVLAVLGSFLTIFS